MGLKNIYTMRVRIASVKHSNPISFPRLRKISPTIALKIFSVSCIKGGMRRLILFLIIALYPAVTLCSATAFAWPAKVLSVQDGDTITVAPGGDTKTPITVRLYGVDAPELGQSYGPEAKDWLQQQLPSGQVVEIVPYGTDRYSRAVGLVQVGKRTLNGELVSAGLAWVYYPHCKAKFCPKWKRAQKKARTKKLGLWQDVSPEKPGDWRKKHPRREKR